MTYPDSVRFLYALGNEIKTAKFGLDRIRTLLHALGDPHHAPNFVHVAGTNGKGSTCAMIDAAMRAAGRRTGLFISPHLQEPTERIQVDGQPVSAEQFAQAFDQVHRAADVLLDGGRIDLHPTYFETVTAMAFLLFRDLGADWVTLETGLGGRLDATNVVQPRLTVITPIDFDHEQFLGNTLSSIAGEKAGILKPSVPTVLARQHPEALDVLQRRAAELGCHVTRAYEAEYSATSDARGSDIQWRGQTLRCPLAGDHQVDNAITAAAALDALGVDPTGIAQARWPGRLEWVSEHPAIILDGAHNPAGARALAAYIARYFRDRRVVLVYGTMRDKAIEEIAAVLFPCASELILTAPNYARALRPEAIAAIANHPNVRIAPTVAEAIAEARADASPEDAIFISGSLFVVGEARQLLVRQEAPAQ